jgi:hypothetical protein
MTGCKCNIRLIIVLLSLFSVQAFPQQVNYGDSTGGYKSPAVNLNPGLHYSIGSTFSVIPHMGSVTGFTVSPYLSVPLSPRLSVDAGIIAGRFYSTLLNMTPESSTHGAYNGLSIFGSASWHFNSQLTFYGTGIKQLAGTSPFNLLPKSSYTIGSNYNFGVFSIGVAVQVSKWDNNFNSFPFNGSQGFYSPYELRPGSLAPFGQ